MAKAKKAPVTAPLTDAQMREVLGGVDPFTEIGQRGDGSLEIFRDADRRALSVARSNPAYSYLAQFRRRALLAYGRAARRYLKSVGLADVRLGANHTTWAAALGERRVPMTEEEWKRARLRGWRGGAKKGWTKTNWNWVAYSLIRTVDRATALDGTPSQLPEMMRLDRQIAYAGEKLLAEERARDERQELSGLANIDRADKTQKRDRDLYRQLRILRAKRGRDATAIIAKKFKISPNRVRTIAREMEQKTEKKRIAKRP